jgi:hypothetical protein
MTSICSRKVSPWLVLAAALFASVAAVPAFAYTAEQQQACSGDAFQFCGPEIPDVDRVTACMIRNKARLSPGCRAHFRPEPAPAAAVGQPTDIRPVARKPVSAKTASAKKASAKAASAKAKKPKKPAKAADT